MEAIQSGPHGVAGAPAAHRCGNKGGSSAQAPAAMRPRPWAFTPPLPFRAAVVLWPYMVPLLLVYFAEYAMQSGTWTAIGAQEGERDEGERGRAPSLCLQRALPACALPCAGASGACGEAAMQARCVSARACYRDRCLRLTSVPQGSQ